MSWVVLIHRVPREPSTPRISIWRKLRALGVAQLGDGTVALPDDARTREQLEWVADQVVQAGGTALLLRAQALAGRDERALAAGMTEARAQEYRELAAAVATAAAADSTPAESARTVRRLCKELRAIQRRDFFPPPERDAAAEAVADLAAKLTQPEAVTPRRAAAGKTRSRA